MNGEAANGVRLEYTVRALIDLRQRISEWVDHRKRADELGRHESQLASLDNALTNPLDELCREAKAFPRGSSPGSVYEACRAFDDRAAVIHRVWTFFATKFDQRDNPPVGRVLAAADDVIWSCYAEPFGNAGPPEPARPPPPLSFVDVVLAPEAIPRHEPPPELRPDLTDTIVFEYLKLLPVPVISLPPRCLDEPWLLAWVGHEVGHHLQYDLAPNWAAMGAFRTVVEDAVRAVPAGGSAAPLWGAWSRELFADACSVYVMGIAALHAMLELEMGTDRTLLDRQRPGYPPPVVRLTFLATLAERLGLDPGGVLHGLGIPGVVEGPILVDDEGTDLRAEAKRDLAIVPAVVKAVAEWSVPGVGPLQKLYDWRAHSHETAVATWACDLRRPNEVYPDPSLRAARHIVAGAMDAWNDTPAAERLAVRSGLATRVFGYIAASRDEETREAVEIVLPDPSALTVELSALLAGAFPTAR